jgi:uncharacterized membrane protein YidH (DUF202 family)
MIGKLIAFGRSRPFRTVAVHASKGGRTIGRALRNATVWSAYRILSMGSVVGRLTMLGVGRLTVYYTRLRHEVRRKAAVFLLVASGALVCTRVLQIAAEQWPVPPRAERARVALEPSKEHLRELSPAAHASYLSFTLGSVHGLGSKSSDGGPKAFGALVHSLYPDEKDRVEPRIHRLYLAEHWTSLTSLGYAFARRLDDAQFWIILFVCIAGLAVQHGRAGWSNFRWVLRRRRLVRLVAALLAVAYLAFVFEEGGTFAWVYRNWVVGPRTLRVFITAVLQTGEGMLHILFGYYAAAFAVRIWARTIRAKQPARILPLAAFPLISANASVLAATYLVTSARMVPPASATHGNTAFGLTLLYALPAVIAWTLAWLQLGAPPILEFKPRHWIPTLR